MDESKLVKKMPEACERCGSAEMCVILVRAGAMAVRTVNGHVMFGTLTAPEGTGHPVIYCTACGVVHGAVKGPASAAPAQVPAGRPQLRVVQGGAR